MLTTRSIIHRPPRGGRVRLTRATLTLPVRHRLAAVAKSPQLINQIAKSSRARGSARLDSIVHCEHAPNRHRPTANRTRNMKTKMKTASKRSRDTANTLDSRDSTIIISYAVHVFIISGVITLDRLSRHDHVMQNTAGGQLQWACGTWGSCGPCAVDWLRTPGSSTHERFCHAPGWHPRASPCR